MLMNIDADELIPSILLYSVHWLQCHVVYSQPNAQSIAAQ